ncbi:hypothetical protein [Burkholderia pseudomultivorans]|uniref:Uncharacterized protein n=1 Tax=Burkholderia pseudomultivorans TaxID=1207504 RepID=A0ABU2EDY3_9BURK|nr:hypothetical protein [Burkholderia pseudomultivorans]MDR8731352.1 hypothetical protein [Burkholderia pseudomultivorans]MDR8738973.1 hypothetical protein [Burkholderia pseudomultivorans]MDR8745524.1 hypothetical protein [Burkholderia pseudomultivorans]MDR8757774.1 hypothetical protein [Burkholderia pseudomultivorans]MDR8781874.1 hypothetical protein [Burkholderia pseudomultivorans]
MTNTTARAPFYWMRPAERTTLARTTEQAFEEAKSTVAAFIHQTDRDDGRMTERDFLDRYGYPASWDNEVPQPRQRPTPAAVAEAMLRCTAGSSDEMDAGLFEGFDHD